MKIKWRAGMLLAALFLSGCDHQKTAQGIGNTPAPRGVSPLTGVPPRPIDSLKTYPRATLVALPGQPIIPNQTASAPVTPPRAAPVVKTEPASSPTPTAMATAAAVPAPVTAPEASAPVPALTMPDDTASAAPGSVGAAASAGATAEPAAPEASEAPDRTEVAVIQTAMGKIVIELDDFAAPKTCKNFRLLIADGFYNNTVFHRVIPRFIIQGGDPKSKTVASDRNTYGLGSPGYTLPPEIALKHDRGAVAMARLPDELNPRRESNGSQFYICLAPCPSLDDQYTVFGHVIQGMDVAEKIAAQPRDLRDNPFQRIEMTVSLQPKDQAVANAATTTP